MIKFVSWIVIPLVGSWLYFPLEKKRISVVISIFNVLKYIFEMPAFRMNFPCVDKFHFLGSLCHM